MAGVSVSKTRTPFRDRFRIVKDKSPSFRDAGKDQLTRRERLVADEYERAIANLPSDLSLLMALGEPNEKILATVVESFTEVSPEVARILWEQLGDSGRQSAEEMKTQLASEYRRIGKAEKPSDLILRFSFNETAPGAVTWARDESSRLITNMVEEQQAVVRQVIQRGMVLGQTSTQQGKEILSILRETRPSTQPAVAYVEAFGANMNGLTLRYEQAVYNRVAKRAADLVESGITGTKATKILKEEANKYSEKLRKARARTIARTEIQRAHNQGRLESYQQLIDTGFASPQAQKKWVVSPFDVCPICVPLRDELVPVAGSFSNGLACPPAHPNCRCTTIMVSNPALYQPPQSLGTGAPDDPFRVRLPGKTPEFQDLARRPLPGTTTRPGRIAGPTAEIISGPIPQPSPTARLIEGTDRHPGHYVESDGRILLQSKDEYRDSTGTWFRRRAGQETYEPFVPSQNSAAGQIEREMKRNPRNYITERPVPKPTPQPTPTPEPTPQPTEAIIVEPVGKVPGHVIATDGRVTIAGKDEYRDASGRWFRRRAGSGAYEEFLPSQNSAAGQLEREIKRNPARYQRTPGVTPAAPTPVARPTIPPGPDPFVDLRPRVRLSNKDDLYEVKGLRTGFRSFEKPLSTVADDSLAAIDEAGRRVEDMVLSRLPANVRIAVEEASKARAASDQITQQILKLGKSLERVEKATLRQVVADLQAMVDAKPELLTDEVRFLLRDSQATLNSRRGYHGFALQDLKELFEGPRSPGKMPQALSEWARESDRVKAVRETLTNERTQLQRIIKAGTDDVQEEYTKATVAVLKEIRDDIGSKSLQVVLEGSRSTATANAKALRTAEGMFPGRWLEAVDQRFGTLTVKGARRGYFSAVKREVVLSGANDLQLASTAYHEVLHAVERAIPELSNAQAIFLARLWEQAGKPKIVKLKKLNPLKGYRNDELGLDLSSIGFLDEYVGKWYAGSNFEILTRGGEGILFEATKGMPDIYRRFIYGLFALL